MSLSECYFLCCCVIKVTTRWCAHTAALPFLTRGATALLQCNKPCGQIYRQHLDQPPSVWTELGNVTHPSVYTFNNRMYKMEQVIYFLYFLPWRIEINNVTEEEVIWLCFFKHTPPQKKKKSSTSNNSVFPFLEAHSRFEVVHAKTKHHQHYKRHSRP